MLARYENTSQSAQFSDCANENVRPIQRVFYYFLFFSFIGFVFESVIFPLYYHHFKEWQGPLHGPWLVLYGFGGLFLLMILGRLLDRKLMVGRFNVMPVVVFLLTFSIVTMVEFVGHWALETFFNVVLWDYSPEPFNLQGRVCLFNSVAFATLGVAVLYLVVPMIEKGLAGLSRQSNRVLCSILLGAFVVDFVYSFGIILVGMF
jgi:uncharacterized membrane protein